MCTVCGTWAHQLYHLPRPKVTFYHVIYQMIIMWYSMFTCVEVFFYTNHLLLKALVNSLCMLYVHLMPIPFPRFQIPVETERSGGGPQLQECFNCSSNQQLVNRTCIDTQPPTEETPTEETPTEAILNTTLPTSR